METLIIAAGYGSRLSGSFPSKPLAPVSGIPLIEIGIRQAMSAGSDGIVVVTGHEAQRLEAALAEISARLEIPVRCARVDDWSKPNGYSVMAGASLIEGEYLLMMADHILSTSILKNLAMAGNADRGVTLAIDRNVDSPLVDPDDATWVRCDNAGRIKAIGKQIEPYDAVDCGAFLATAELADAIRAAIRDGAAGSLSDGMQRLAEKKRAATLDIGDAWWIDVDDLHAHTLAEAQAPRHIKGVFSGASA